MNSKELLLVLCDTDLHPCSRPLSGFVSSFVCFLFGPIGHRCSLVALQNLGCLPATRLGAPDHTGLFANVCFICIAAANWDMAGASRDVAGEKVQLQCSFKFLKAGGHSPSGISAAHHCMTLQTVWSHTACQHFTNSH